MPRSVVRLPKDVREPFSVWVSGVPQVRGRDYEVRDDGTLVFEGRRMAKDKVSGWRWFLGAWGVGTYRQDDQVDVRYEVGGAPRSAVSLEIRVEE
jgi:hypothetical protein